MKTGIYDLAAADYHEDPGEVPSLTASTIKWLTTHSPKHAWTHHPRLNPEFEREDKTTFDLGTAAHSVFLQGGENVGVVAFDDWKKQAARDERDAIRAAGRVPLLAKDWERVQAMVAALRQQLDQLDVDPPLFTAGKPEQTLVWEHDGVLCRARLDWLRTDHRAIDDLKTVPSKGGTANPHDWTRRAFWAIGADIQAVWYQRGLRALTGKNALFRYLVAECRPPYAISVVDLEPSAVELAEQKIDRALRVWRDCLERDEWPAYGTHVASVGVDAWQEADFLRRHWEQDEEGVAA